MHLPRILIAALVALAVSGCQRTVSSDLPMGPDAYTAIAVPDEVAMPSVYRFTYGDRVSVRVLNEKEFSVEKALVDQSGNLSVPMVGTIRVAGMTQDELADLIRQRLAASYLRDPRVAVAVDTPAVTTIAVEGEVELPGVYEIAPGSTLLTSMALARSPTNTAKLDEVFIFRMVNGQRVGGRFDLAAIRAGRVADPRLVPGDTVVVGISRVRSIFQDFLATAPLLNLLVRY